MVSYLHLLFAVLLFFFFSTLFMQNCFAEEYTQMGLPEGAKARLGKGNIKDLLYSPKGDILAVVSSIGIWIYDTNTYQEQTLLPIPLNRNRPFAYRITQTTFSVDGQTLVSETKEKKILIWNIVTGEHKEINLINGVSFSDDRQTLTIEAENKTIELWHGKREKREKQYGEIEIIIAYCPDGQTYATADGEHNILIRDTGTQKLKKRIIGYPDLAYLSKISVSPDGKMLAALRGNSPIRLWDINTGKLKKTLVGHKVTTKSNRNHGPYAPFSNIDSVAFSPDGKTLANGSLNGTIRLWDTSSGKLKRTLKDQIGFIKSLTFSPDGKLLASGSEDGSILVWDTETWKNKLYLAERVYSISCVSFIYFLRIF